MDLRTAITLIQSPAIKSNALTNWADLGCGSGLFTKGLSSLLQSGSKIIAVDKDASSLKKVIIAKEIILEKLHADFINEELPLQNLDGILMANALHFVKDKNGFIQRLRSYVNKTAAFLIVEYDTDQSNPWVPYPLNVAGWQKLFKETGYSHCEVINRHPSLKLVRAKEILFLMNIVAHHFMTKDLSDILSQNTLKIYKLSL
ncbi:MAG: methyltransferase domain-containing protein [Ginsengibacter sp.]